MSDVIEIDADVTETEYLTADVATTESIDADVTESVGGGGGATDYEVLVNKPQINGVTLVGDLSTADLGIHAGVQDVLVDDVSIVDSNYEAHIPIANQQRTGLIPATWMDKLFHIESGAQVNVQADWNQSISTFDSYIKNKPNLATVAESGSYNDLLNKPKISEIQNDAGYVAYLSQFGIAYLEATDDYAGSSLNEGKFFTGYMPQTQPAPFYLSNGSLIAVKFPTDAIRRPREGGAYAAPALRIYTRLQPPDSYTSYIPINYKGTMIPSKQIKANDIALLVYDSDNDCFEHLGHTEVEQYSATKSGIVPAAGNVYETGEWKLLSNMGWLTVGAIPDYDSQYIYWARKYSPAFTGVPTAPTAASGTDTTQIATTAFVQDTVNTFEAGLGAKSSLTTSDYIRVVGSDNEAYKQSVSSVINAINTKNAETVWISDCNDATDPTKLYTTNANTANRPNTSAGYWFIRVGGASGQMLWQIAETMNSISPSTYVRKRNNEGTWGAWTQEPTRTEVDALNSKTYSTSGLTYAGCSHTRGGYCVQGNLVIVNISVNTTSAGATVSGFPAPQFTIGFGGYDGSNEKPIFAYMNTSGTLVFPGAITQLGSFNISLTYVKA